MQLLPISEVQFDETDANLFLVEDLRLRGDALKHSVLPRMNRVMHEAIGRIRSVLKIEALEDSIVSQYPNFRTKRTSELTTEYDSAFVGLGGKRSPQWGGFSRKDGKPVQILPFRFAFSLTESGLSISLQNAWLKGLSEESSQALLRFHVENEPKINALCFEAGMRPCVGYAPNVRMLSPIPEHYRFRQENGLFDNDYLGHPFHFPIGEAQIQEVIDSFVSFYPIYDSYIQIAKGAPNRFEELWGRLCDWLESEEPVVFDTQNSSTGSLTPVELASLAEKRVRVMLPFAGKSFNGTSGSAFPVANRQLTTWCCTLITSSLARSVVVMSWLTFKRSAKPAILEKAIDTQSRYEVLANPSIERTCPGKPGHAPDVKR